MPSDGAIREALAGKPLPLHGYEKILDAVRTPRRGADHDEHATRHHRRSSRGPRRRALYAADAGAEGDGHSRTPSDLHADGMLWGATVRSPHPHARIRGIDVSAGVAHRRASSRC